jgi:BirA family transcriptional regulator, biotin operon repressor / biotin---[acetyl-CoA-carboxylase] ligase
MEPAPQDRPFGRPMEAPAMLSEDSLLQAVRAAGIEAPPRYSEVTGSTNADALGLAERGAPEWTVVAAGHQTSGRGRLGRAWAGAAGRSLTFSVVLRPATPAGEVPVLSLLAAERLAAACDELTEAEVRCKWPNDLVVEDRKLAGILPEAAVSDGRVRHLVIGIGLNVSMEGADFPEDVRPHATSLALEAGGAPDHRVLLERFLALFRHAYPPAGAQAALGAYGSRCVTLGRRVRATAAGGETVEGLATGLDADGGLEVETSGGPRVVSFGEVVHLR